MNLSRVGALVELNANYKDDQMSQQHHNPGTLMSEETSFDEGDEPGIAQPISQSEIEELLYGDDRPAEQRLERLHEIRHELAARESADFGGEDPAALLGEVDRAIASLGTDADNADESDDYASLSAPDSRDPSDHLDSLSPDDVEAIEDIEGAGEVVEDDVIWDDGRNER
ncbi:hypothetical protein PSQ19_16750 [Devosia algicola]|uniref:DUF3072 domain-containing protein n=1 Tax=Devosia algicola TaxID=3026418 RepID=A0ABY7YM61_9HYPH|nr:hypothetical protein [Devosia algicola]WDR02263.1 hypothetical protein PSQ19_16750 [Devosia algicola]